MAKWIESKTNLRYFGDEKIQSAKYKSGSHENLMVT